MEPLSGNECEVLLQNLLAIIHRDGGHYTHKHGIQKSVDDAVTEIALLRVKGFNEGQKYTAETIVQLRVKPLPVDDSTSRERAAFDKALRDYKVKIREEYKLESC